MYICVVSGDSCPSKVCTVSRSCVCCQIVVPNLWRSWWRVHRPSVSFFIIFPMWPGVMCFELSGCDGNTQPCFQLSRSAIDSVIGRIRSLLPLPCTSRFQPVVSLVTSSELILAISHRRKPSNAAKSMMSFNLQGARSLSANQTSSATGLAARFGRFTEGSDFEGSVSHNPVRVLH